MKPTFHSITPMIPTCGGLAEALSFYGDHMGFSIQAASLDAWIDAHEQQIHNAAFGVIAARKDELCCEAAA